MFKIVLSSLLTVCASLCAAPKAIVFDFGGVMTTEPNKEAVVQFLRASFKLTQAEFENINQEKRKAVKAGKTDAEFWLQYAKERHITLPPDWLHALNQVMQDAIGVNPHMYALVEKLKAKQYKIALLSNIDERLGKLIREFGLYKPFTPCLLSYEIGLEKPDLRIYQVLLKELNLPANEIIFIDDRQENIEAAKSLGFDAILFTSECSLTQQLINRAVLQ